ncbi:MAG: accessory factor UbiK family protein [Pseudomonadota bacterium]
MTTEETVRGLASRLAEALPAHLRTAGGDIERSFRGVLQTSLGKMNLVTREEFDVQATALARAQERLGELEALLSELEAQVE